LVLGQVLKLASLAENKYQRIPKKRLLLLMCLGAKTGKLDLIVRGLKKGKIANRKYQVY